ncbi:hypothetical protein DFH08DRAFT_800994 [Mycena albidolilacea]|uniref:Uncharacterized protein n=1 Tax=Mycena albidolilacea TaxID=1033008 RepID=A0AAD7AHG6_9AGAR|nr:hypothetical protein DFH08DRAFT_800994 [Mycena albidolilacea]
MWTKRRRRTAEGELARGKSRESRDLIKVATTGPDRCNGLIELDDSLPRRVDTEQKGEGSGIKHAAYRSPFFKVLSGAGPGLTTNLAEEHLRRVGVLQAQKDRNGDDGSERQAGKKERKTTNQMSSYHAILHIPRVPEVQRNLGWNAQLYRHYSTSAKFSDVFEASNNSKCEARLSAALDPLFRSLVLPHLFREQTFDVAVLGRGLDKGNWMDRVRHLHRTAVRLDRLAEGSFPPSVHTWKVTFSRGMLLSHSHPDIENIHLFDTLSNRVLRTFFATLKNYRNLASLHIGFTTIDLFSRETLISLLSLKDLHLHNCDIVAAEGLLTVDGLKMVECSPTQSVRLVCPDTLRTLDIVPRISPLIAGFGSDTLRSLVNLSVQRVCDTKELFRFLSQCPQLQYLAIQTLTDSLPAVPHSTIPLLRSLTAPSNIVRELAPGRPVGNVVIFDGLTASYLMPVCIDISRGTVPLHTLCLSCWLLTWDILAAILSLFPELKELSLKLLPGGYGYPGQDGTSGTSYSPVDRQTLVLNDDEAFLDSPPADNISDVESEDLPPFIVTKHMWVKKLYAVQEQSNLFLFHMQSQYQDVLEWLMDGSLSFPPNIEVFRVEEHATLFGDPDFQLPVADQHQVIAVLSRLYMHLREVQFGSELLGSSWTRTGDLWAREVSGCREVVKIIVRRESNI